MTPKRVPPIRIPLSKQEKEELLKIATRCGLSLTDYVKQRALGYAPKGPPPKDLFRVLEEVDQLRDRAVSDETDEAILSVLRELRERFLTREKESS